MSRTTLPVLPLLDDTGSVLRREALEAGLRAEDVRWLVRQGTWVRIRRGAYATRTSWTSMSDAERHLVTARAVLRSLVEPAVLGHVSAAVVWGLPVWGADLSRVHVIRPARRHGARTESGVVHHSATLPDAHVRDMAGIPVTSPGRTLVDHARSTSFEPGVVTLDAGLHRGLTTQAELLDLLTWQLDWPGSRAAGRAIAFADPLPESPGESRGRVRIAQAGLPEPVLQAEIRDTTGRFVGRTDFLFEGQRTIGEFDGRIKYRGRVAGQSLEDVLWQEKEREDKLRSLGYEVVRFVWDDLDRSPTWLRQRFREAFSRASGRPRL